MDERERPRPERETGSAGGGGAQGSGLAGARASAERLLSAADDAIARALSEDSEQFLRESRQQGGQ